MGEVAALQRWRGHPERTREVPSHRTRLPVVPLPSDVVPRWRAGETLPLVDQIDGATCRYTWVSDEAGLVWINGLFDARNLEQSYLRRVEGEARLWALSLRLPLAWVGSYLLIGSQFLETLPQVTTEASRRHHTLALMKAGQVDSRGRQTLRGQYGPVSVGHGPEISPLWGRTAVDPNPITEAVVGGRKIWCYSPAERTDRLLVLFDGQVWARRLRLGAALERLIEAKVVAPLRVVMVDAGGVEQRWEELGTPRGQVEAVLQDVIPWCETWLGAGRLDIMVCGQSLGGLAALWAALDHRVKRVLAQSPSVWRFDMSVPLRQAGAEITVQAGRFEGDMLALAEELGAGLGLKVQAHAGGHDWAWWYTALLEHLALTWPGLEAQHHLGNPEVDHQAGSVDDG